MTGAAIILDGASGGEEMVWDGTARGIGAAAAAGSGALAGLVTRLSLSPERLPNTRLLQGGRYLPSNLSIKGDSRDAFAFLVSLRPVRRCAICKNISVVR